jgi:hypothetical protein
MNFPKEYEEYLKLPTPELAEIMGGHEELKSKANIARLVYEERQMEKKHEYEKEQIELEHKLNMELMTKQLRWIKFSALLNAVAIIAGVLLGWLLAELKSLQNLSKNTRQMIQSQSEPSTSASHSEQKSYKAPALQLR